MDAQLDEPATVNTTAETTVEPPPVVEQTELAQEVDAGKDEEEPGVTEHGQVNDAGAASGGEALGADATAATAGSMQAAEFCGYKPELPDGLVTVNAEVDDGGVVIHLNLSNMVGGA